MRLFLPVSFSQSMIVELDIVFDSSDREDKEVERGSGGDMIENGAEIVLDVVDLLLVLVDDLVSVEDHVTAEESRQTSREPNTEKPIECLQTFWIKIFQTFWIVLIL